MKLFCEFRSVEEPKSDSIVIYAYEGSSTSNKHLKDLNEWTDGAIDTVVEVGEFGGKKNESARLYPKNGIPSKRVFLFGLGKKRDLSTESARHYGGSIGRLFRKVAVNDCTVFLPGPGKAAPKAQEISQAVTEGILLGAHRLLDYKSSENGKPLPESVCVTPADKAALKSSEKGCEIGEITAWAQNTARELVAHPPIVLTPTRLAEYAKRFASDYKFKCTVLEKSEIKKLKMGCLEAVNLGSDQPPKFIILEYKGPKAKKNTVCLIGKGITFDSGGYSLKDAANMVDMKGDMAGGACVIAAVAAAARLELPIHVVGLVPATENLVSGKGYKPGDIIKSYNGKTIEITNTDAEGRLILADALGYARKFKPAAIVDMATLTGACRIALGYTGAGYFANDDRLAARLERASGASAEKIWRMPLWEEYQQYIKSTLADIKNSAGKVGSLGTSAAFLANFVGDHKWAHIDIAGMDVDIKGGAYITKGSSGFGARLLVEFLRAW